jgi:exopolysaccharide biosynthesis polyprenyl glycosylphosphotransferase
MQRRFLWLVDAVAMTAAVLAARETAPAIQMWLAVGGPLRSDLPAWLPLAGAYDPAAPHSAAGVALIALPLAVLALEMSRAYARVDRQTRLRLLWNCLLGPTVGLAAGTITAFMFQVAGWSRAFALSVWIYSVLAFLAHRIAFRAYKARRRIAGHYAHSVAVIGRHAEAVHLLERLETETSPHDYRARGYYEVGSAASGLTPDYAFARLGSVTDLADSLMHTCVDLVVVAESDGSGEWLPEVLRTCDYFRIPVQVVPASLLAVSEGLTDLRPRRSEDQLPFAGVVFETSEMDGDSAFVKRMLDTVISAVALVVLAPLFVVIAIAIKLTTPGLSAIYGYTQVGLRGRKFTAYKFTTMIRDAEYLKAALMAQNEMQGPVFKIRNDPRVTRLGKILRVTSLNELPQLWNVLTGDLSLVGPRAALPNEFAGYKVWHKRKLAVQPGLTCLWQVGGRNRISDFDEWVRLDLKYIDTRSIWLDMKILARTAWVVLKCTGS